MNNQELKKNKIQFSESQFRLVKENFKYHFNSCEHFKRYCSNSGFDVEKLNKSEDITKIPLIPTQLFKNTDILSVPMSEIMKKCTSSGTKGSISKIYRDNVTMDNLLNGILEGTKEVLGINLKEYKILNLGPNAEEAKDLWFAYVMSQLDRLTKTKNYMVNNVLLLDEFASDLQELGSETKVVIIGPPIFLVTLCDYIEKHSIHINLNPEAVLLTAGGWKRFQGSAISREELEERLNLNFGISKERFRDAFNSVELNSVVFECKNKNKHLPERLVAVARDTSTLEPLKYGEEGILSFIDTSANSYPCFVLSDDFGIVYSGHDCDCGSGSPYVQISRRIETVEARGCALKMSKTYVKE